MHTMLKMQVCDFGGNGVILFNDGFFIIVCIKAWVQFIFLVVNPAILIYCFTY